MSSLIHIHLPSLGVERLIAFFVFIDKAIFLIKVKLEQPQLEAKLYLLGFDSDFFVFF